VDDRALDSLQKLGLTLYEARLYLGLLTHGAQNGNELSRSAEVPSSKVYSTLHKLVAAGYVSQVRRDGSAEYVCIPPDELVQRLRAEYERPLDYLEGALPSLAATEPDADVLQITSAEAILHRGREVIGAAGHEVFVSLWDESLEAMRGALTAADARGVDVYGMIYGTATLDVGSWQQHSYQEVVASRIAGHMLTVVADGREALLAHMPAQGTPTGVHTRNPVLCLIAEEYLRHDHILQKAKTMTGYEEWDRWLHRDEVVRSLTFGRTGKAGSMDPA
jgi:HTH-type transcriptional regulator, sugar sensing transcriptional regulator